MPLVLAEGRPSFRALRRRGSRGSQNTLEPGRTSAEPGADRRENADGADSGASRALEDRRLLIRYHRHGDQAAREELVQRLLPLARRMARRYRRSDEPMDDVVQVGDLGLINAIDRFDPDRGVHSRPSRCRPSSARSSGTSATTADRPRPARDAGARGAGQQRRPRTSPQLGRTPTTAEIAERPRITEDEVLVRIEAASAYHAISLEACQEGDGCPASRTASAYEDPALDGSSTATSADLLAAARAGPHPAAPALLRGPDPVQISANLGVSQMHVSRLIRRALERLRTVAEHSG